MRARFLGWTVFWGTALALLLACAQGTAAEKKAPLAPGGIYKVHDKERPQPLIVTPPTASTQERPGTPPSDAIVLFDGSNLDAWTMYRKREKPPVYAAPSWKVENGYMEVVPDSGDLQSKQEFGDCQIHVEWQTPPKEAGKTGQGVGNSGVFLLGQIELQVLDSYGNETYPDGQAGGLYGKYPPLVNASRGPREWQVYDIIFEAPKFDGDKKAAPARMSVLHNGVLIHHAVDPEGNAAKVKIALQDHRNTVRYRNVWVRELHAYDYQGE